MKFLIGTVMALGLASIMHAQESAKSLFGDPTSGTVIQAGSNRSSPKTGSTTQRSSLPPEPSINTRLPSPDSQTAAGVTGLMYWVELRTPSDQLLRVDSKRVFHSGERIRLHVTSNVDGHLVLMQSQDAGPLQTLFPTDQSPDNAVQGRQEKVFPSEKTWFRFDNQPGQLNLLLLVTARQSSSGSTQVAANTLTPQRQLALQQGSKALLVEEENVNPATTATYVVYDARKDNQNGGAVATEIKLTHRP